MEVTETTVEKPIATFTLRMASVTALPFLGFVCYAGPYVTGLIYRGTYLGGFNIPDGLFKSNASDYFIYAYLAVIETFKNWTSFISSPAVWAAMVFVIGLFTAEFLLLPKLLESSMSRSIGARLGRNKYVAVSTGVMSFALAITTVLLLIPLVLFPFLILPALVGQYGGQQVLKRDLALYDQGCDQPLEIKDQCHAVMDNSRVIASGFVIAESDNHLALYKSNKSVIMPIKDFAITTVSADEYRALTASATTAEPPSSPR